VDGGRDRRGVAGVDVRCANVLAHDDGNAAGDSGGDDLRVKGRRPATCAPAEWSAQDHLRDSDLALGLVLGVRFWYGRAFIAGRTHADSNRRTSSISESSW
jgi:hypothetical protein